MKLVATPSNLRWLMAYLLTLAILVLVVMYTRTQVLATFGTPQATAEWQAWREAAGKQTQRGPVRRRMPKSPEPPALVLMRDHFAVVMTAAVVFGSLLFATFMIAVRGVMARSTRSH